MEYLVVPIASGIARNAKNKLVSQVKVIEVGEDEDDGSIEDHVLKAMGRPSSSTRYLVIPLEEAVIVKIKPSVEWERTEYESYLAL